VLFFDYREIGFDYRKIGFDYWDNFETDSKCKEDMVVFCFLVRRFFNFGFLGE